MNIIHLTITFCVCVCFVSGGVDFFNFYKCNIPERFFLFIINVSSPFGKWDLLTYTTLVTCRKSRYTYAQYTGLVIMVQGIVFIGNMLSWLSFHNFV